MPYRQNFSDLRHKHNFSDRLSNRPDDIVTLKEIYFNLSARLNPLYYLSEITVCGRKLTPRRGNNMLCVMSYNENAQLYMFIWLTGKADTIICEGKDFTLLCPNGVIKISSAVYGRTRGSQVCPHPEITVTNCRSPTSTAKAKSLCNGKKSCRLEANNRVFGDPCPGNYKYLQVKHTCG